MRCMINSIGGVALLLATQSAWSQSTLTLYGVADVFLQYQGNGSTHSIAGRSGGNSGSSFGLKGEEDLGNGLKAKFTLESGYNINNGTSFVDSSSLFYRQAWAGLTHADYGSLSFGRQYQPTFWAIYYTDPFRGDEALSPVAAAAVAVDRSTLATQAASGRTSNSIEYQSPVVGGFKLYTMYAFESTTAQPVAQSVGNLFDVAVTYTGGALFVGLAYQNQHAGSEALPGLPATLNLLGTERFTGAIAYRLGIVNLQANYTYNRSRDAAAGSLAAQLGASHPYSFAEVGATIQATVADTIGIAGIERSARGAHDSAEGIEVGIDHTMSKRTQIYARCGYIKNHGSSTVSWPAASVTELGSSQRLVALGLTHRF
ncbi:porin [Paraburkholderia sartisoli]|uniref:Outer membrane protein (Porin) n=1 Tax=Paraburkholderia sartisoli TaxID=83784 RepID=A0A1H4B1C8_9BURK|nr:porin [Paraburkholderia sartisoli]SEA41692.1 Outer membrane protein (porin) [Paraburkholderia sartisoli]